MAAMRAGVLGAIATVALGTALGGCGGVDGVPRQRVSGAVTLDGQPLDAGMILFEPTAGQASSAGAMIADGRYDVARDKGPTPGPYLVRIYAPGKAAAPQQLGDPVKPAPDRVPAKYNSKSTLTADVTAGGPNTFNFEVTSK
jgi:hypothetical protein